jgi:hypothetical protein
MVKERNASDLPRSRPFSRLLKVLSWIAVILCGCLLLQTIYRNIGFIKTSPDAALLPTAEYLYAHPQPTLDYVQVSSHDSDVKNRICYWDGYRDQDDVKTHPRLEDFPSSLLFLNGSQVPLSAVHTEINSASLEEDLHLASCFYTTGLSTGMHLVELHLKANPWDTPIIYQWVVMLE